MPRLKQPISLRKLAFDFLVEQCVHYCDALSICGYLSRLRQSVADIKHYVNDHVTAVIFEEFCRTFLGRFYQIGVKRPSIGRPASHHRVALEMIMDVKIVGLTIEGCMIDHFDPNEAPRVHGLKILNWGQLVYNRLTVSSLGNFNLHDLTTFIFPMDCTDNHLLIVAFQCPKLQVLRAPVSHVTDSGLCALTRCTDLRVVSIHGCSVSDYGVNELLNKCTKLEEFDLSECEINFETNINILSRSTSLVCPSMKRFSLRSNTPVTNAHLISVASLFPNLTYFDGCCLTTTDLCILKDLKNLTELRLNNSFDFILENLKQLLMIVGENISVLTLQHCRNPISVGLTLYDLDYLLKFCGNIEHLEFDYQPRLLEETLVIPRFKKLRTLGCFILASGHHDEDSRVRLEFGEMLALECLYIENVHQTFHMIESMMLDNVRFPKLRKVGRFDYPNEHTNRIHEIAKRRLLEAMPRLKQPISLRKLAFDLLLEHCVHYCDNLSWHASLTRLHQSVLYIKHYVNDHVPAIIYEEFCRKFLEKFYQIDVERRMIERPASHYRIVLELIMDIKIVGLTFEADMVNYFDLNVAKRVRGLKILKWTSPNYNHPIYWGLENFHLRDLTTFIFPISCTDDHLRIIASQCSKLEVLDIQASEVTEYGLGALLPLTDLRVINIQSCVVSNHGINKLLDIHKKLEEFTLGYINEFPSIPLVCPSIRRFSLRSETVTDAHLTSIVTLFPNLTCLEYCCQNKGDLCILKDLKNLTELRFRYIHEFSLQNLAKLLMIVGENITVLSLGWYQPGVGFTQQDVKFIFKFCGNIEHLEFDYQPRQLEETLVIPPFKKLKALKCTVLIQRHDFEPSVRLEFGEILALEYLSMRDFYQTFNTIESIMLDNVKFPKLRDVGTFERFNEHADRIREIAKSKNLDFSLLFQQDIDMDLY